LFHCIITPLDQAKAQFDMNFFGTVNGNKAVLPYMREAGKGHIEKYICQTGDLI
jgi:short-chain dehydrogenases of various substrate specificities